MNLKDKNFQEFLDSRKPEILLYESDIEDLYNEMLDCEGTVTIAGLEYAVSDALKSVDPTAYRCGMGDFRDSENILEVTMDYDGSAKLWEVRESDLEEAWEEFESEQEEQEEENE